MILRTGLVGIGGASVVVVSWLARNYPLFKNIINIEIGEILATGLELAK